MLAMPTPAFAVPYAAPKSASRTEARELEDAEGINWQYGKNEDPDCVK
jgi:hypothetical protein